MSEESTFFLPIKKYFRRDLITCQQFDRVVDAAVVMHEKSISSLVVTNENNEPIGIMTDRDLRSKVVAGSLDPATTRVQQVMTSPVISVAEDDSLFEGLYQMSKHRIHRVGVVDRKNQLVGIINESDIIQLQNRSPQKLLRNIDEAQSIAALQTIHAASEELIIFLSRSGVKTKDLIKLISLLNDQIFLRLIEILQLTRFPQLPQGFACLVLGSEGRQEQTLKTDQDNAIIYADNLSSTELDQIELFSEALITGLIEIGVPECPGGIMAKNPFWRRSITSWREAIDSWIATPSGENILNFSMFSDMRTLWGDLSLEQELRRHVISCTHENEIFLVHMAANVCRFPPPLGFFGKIKTEKLGNQPGLLDLKKAGIFALTEGIKTQALGIDLLGGSTADKIIALQQQQIIDRKQAGDLEAAFNLLTFFRLRSQIDQAEAGEELTNFLAPAALNRVERGRLRVALEVVRSFQDSLSSQFQLSMLGR